MISKNLIEAKKELHDNYQENQSLAEKKKTKSPVKDIKIKVVSDKIKLNRNRSSNVVRPSTTSNNKSCANKKINYSKKIENKQLNLSANQTEDLDIIEFKPCEKIISTQTKINKLVEINKHDMRNQMNKCKLSKQDELKNASFDSYREKEDNFGDSQQELEENEEEERENYSRTYDEKEVKNEFNDNMIDKFDNLNSIEESMKKLNDILEVSSKNSIKNRYNYGIDKIEKEVSALKDNFGTKEPKKKNDKDFNKSEEKEFVIHQEDNNIENNINLLEKDLKMLQDKFKFRDDDYNYDQSKDNQLFLNDFPKKNIIPKDIYSIEFMEETPMTLPKPFLNSSSIKKYPKRDINKPNLLVFNNDNYNEKSVKNTKNIYNESKIVNVPKPKDFNNKHIESEIQNDGKN